MKQSSHYNQLTASISLLLRGSLISFISSLVDMSSSYTHDVSNVSLSFVWMKRQDLVHQLRAENLGKWLT